MSRVDDNCITSTVPRLTACTCLSDVADQWSQVATPPISLYCVC